MNSSYFYNSLNMFSHPSLIPQNYPYSLFNHQYTYPDYYQPPRENKPQASIDITFRTDIVKWLKQLTRLELISIFTIKNIDTVQILLKMYIYDSFNEPSCYAKKQNLRNTSDQLDSMFLIRKQANDQHEAYKATTQLISFLQILGGEQLFGVLCFQDQVFSNLDQLLNLLQLASEGNFLSYQPRIIPNRNFVDDLLWFNPQSFQTLGSWLVNELEKNIALCYKKRRFIQLELSCQDIDKFWKGIDKSKIINQAFNEYKEDNWYIHLLRYQKKQDETHLKQLCDRDDFIQNIYLTSFSDLSKKYPKFYQIILVQPITCIAKNLFRIVNQQYREKLEQDLIASEEQEKKKHFPIQKKKKNRKQKTKSPADVLSFFTFESENEKEFLNFQKIHVYSTHPNSPKFTKNQSFEVQPIQNEMEIDFELIENQFAGLDDSEMTQFSISLSQQLIGKGLQCYRQELEYQNNQLKEMKKERKKVKRNEKIQRLRQENKIYEKEKKQNNENKERMNNQSAKDEIWSQDDEQWKDQQGVPSFKNSNLYDLSQKSHTTLTTSKETSEEEILFQVLQKKPFNKKTKSQKTQASYYKGYQIKSDSNLKLARSNNFPLRRQEEGQDQTKSQKKEEEPPKEEEQIESNVKSNISPIKEEANENKVQKNYQQYSSSRNNEQNKQDEQQRLDEKIEEQAKEKVYEKLTNDIQEYTDELLNIFFHLLPQRTVIFNRIKLLIQSLFCILQLYFLLFCLESEIRLFGSCVTGLALPDSDIDIGILGFELFPRSQLIILINQLVAQFQNCPWVISLKPIFSCAVPLLKLEIDPTIQDEFSIFNLTEQQIVNFRKEQHDYLNVDISFNKKGEHFGQISTEKVLDWIKESPQLQQLVLAFKAIVKSRGLNEPYRGGLSSYCQIIMVKSFLQQKQNESIGKLFVEFCEFYGNEFNPQKTGIRIANENESSGFFELSGRESKGITIISPISEKVISQTSKEAGKVLEELKKVVQSINHLKKVYYKYLVNKKKRRYRKNNLEILNESTKDNFIYSVVNNI